MSDEVRELSLVSRVEMRIALTDSDTKLQSLLQTYLAPLLLKLASPNASVRAKVVGLCQHINTRIRPLRTLQLPVPALLRQFRDIDNPLVRNFDLHYIRLGVERMGTDDEKAALVPELVGGIAKIGGRDGSSGPASGPGATAVLFNLVLKLLPLFRLPPRGAPGELELRERLGMSADDAAFLVHWLTKVLLLVPPGGGGRTAVATVTTCPGLTPAEYRFVNKDAEYRETWNSSSPDGLSIVETKMAIAKFLASGAFTQAERLLPAIIVSADSNGRISAVGEDMFKHMNVDLENIDVVKTLFSICLGSGDAPPARPPVQTKILNFLSRSVRATAEVDSINRLLVDLLAEDEGTSRAAGLEGERLRGQVFTFITWVGRMGTPANLQQVAPAAVRHLMDFVAQQGWPQATVAAGRLSAAQAHVRTLAYETVGILAAKIDRAPASNERVDADLEIVRWLFASLAMDDSVGQISVSIEQGLGSILNALASAEYTDPLYFYGKLHDILQRYISLTPGLQLPWSFSGLPAVRSTKYTAVRFANRCLPYDDVFARWIDLIAVSGGDNERAEIVEEGKRGLDPYWYRMLNPPSKGSWVPAEAPDEPRYRFPKLDSVVEFLFSEKESLQTDERPLLIPRRFTGGDGDSGPIMSFAPSVTFARNLLLREALAAAGTQLSIEPDWDLRLDTAITTQETARSAARTYINQSSGAASVLQAAFGGLVYNKKQIVYGLGRCGKDFVELASLASDSVLESLCPYVAVLKGPMLSNNLSAQDTASQAFGILASHPRADPHMRQSVLTELSNQAAAWGQAVGQAANRTSGALLGATHLLTRSAYRCIGVDSEASNRLVVIVSDMVRNAHDMTLREAAHHALGQLSLAGVSVGSTDDERSSIIDALVGDAKKEKGSAIAALGKYSLTLDSGTAEFDRLISSLYALHEVKRPEVQFSVGEALCIVAAGWESKTLMTEFDVDAPWPQSKIPPAVLEKMLDKVIVDCKASKPAMRKAAPIWQLCLLEYCGTMAAMQARLRTFQATFAWLLGDRDEVVQETGSRGLSVVYSLGNRDVKDDLVRDLVRTFTGEGSNGNGNNNNALGGGRVTEETELFEPGALPTGDGNSVTTYKDIVGLASEVGDPSLVYRFMSLAANNAVWSSRAAVGRFGLGNVLSDASVDGYLATNPKLYAKLFRYRFDPNSNVQRAMNDIWNALVRDSNAAVEQHFDAIMEDLLRSIMAGKEWRVRQASCAAIADLVQGRPVEKYERFVDAIWERAFKVLDDIKGSVRAAAQVLCQVLAGTVLRTLDAGGQDSTARGRKLLAHVVPFLLGPSGMEAAAAEVQGFAINTLTRIIKKAPAGALRPYAPELIGRFVMGLSSLEPQAVNYVHLNADKYGMTSHEIDQLRLSAVRTSPMMEAIELYLLDVLDEDSMAKTADVLDETVRSAIGLPSKVGASRVLVILCGKPALFGRHAGRFMVLVRKVAVDRNETVSAAYGGALGYLTRLAPEEQVLKTISFARGLYFGDDNGDADTDDSRKRLASGEIMGAMARLAGDAMAKVAASWLPFIFVGLQDDSMEVRERFEPAWREHVSGPRAATALYLDEMLETLLMSLSSSRWAVRHAAARATGALVVAFGREIDSDRAVRVWPAVERAIGGKTWEGKEVVLRDAFVRFCQISRAGAVVGATAQREAIGKAMRVSLRSGLEAVPWTYSSGIYDERANDD